MRDPTSRPPPFEFRDCALITLSVGRSAQNLRELRDRLAEAPAESIWHHFHETLMRPVFDDPEFPNDFASWARRALHDDVLAERLGVIDPVEFDDIEQLRQHLIDVVEDRMFEVPYMVQAAPSHVLSFLRSQTVVLTTDLRAATPREMGERIPALPLGSLFVHVIEARRWNADHVDDFTNWLALWGPGTQAVRQRLAAARMHHGPLSELRERLAACFHGIEPWESTAEPAREKAS
jgi:hypothetical protein